MPSKPGKQMRSESKRMPEKPMTASHRDQKEKRTAKNWTMREMGTRRKASVSTGAASSNRSKRRSSRSPPLGAAGGMRSARRSRWSPVSTAMRYAPKATVYSSAKASVLFSAANGSSQRRSGFASSTGAAALAFEGSGKSDAGSEYLSVPGTGSTADGEWSAGDAQEPCSSSSTLSVPADQSLLLLARSSAKPPDPLSERLSSRQRPPLDADDRASTLASADEASDRRDESPDASDEPDDSSADDWDV